MSGEFGAEYAGDYDLLYRDKDYPGECEAIERCFLKYASGRVRTLLDLGCGTGGYLLPLADRGFEGTGVDRSEWMLAQARRKAGGRPVNWHLGDLKELDLGRSFDAVLMMFAVLGYQLGDGDVSSALRAVRRHLEPGGLFVFDVWHGPAVLAQGPSMRVKDVAVPEGLLRRLAAAELDTDARVCAVSYHVQRLKEGQVIRETSQTHRVRYFFPEELERFLREAGLSLLRLGAFPDFEKEASEKAWNVLGIARAA